MIIMQFEQKTNLFEEMPISKAVAKLSIPTIMSALVMVLYNMADTYFVGLLNRPVETAAVTLAAPVLLAFNAVSNLFGVGSSSVMSRAMGSKEYETVKNTSVFGFYCALFSAALFSLLCLAFYSPLLRLLGADAHTMDTTRGYMNWTIICGAVPSILNVVFAFFVRSEGAALHASIGTMSGCVLNMVLDPIFIMPWGLDMGAAGAGLATFLSNCFACMYYFVLLYCRRKSTLVCINPKRFRFRKEIASSVCGVGVPAAIQNLLNVTGMTLLNNFTAGYGADAIAAMGIAQKIQMVPLQIALGATQGVMPLISYNYASGNRARMKESILYLLKRILIFMAVIVAACLLGADSLVRLFMNNDTIVSYGARLLRGFVLALPFMCVDYMAVGMFQAIGAGKKALLFAFLRKIALEIPAIVVLNAVYPLFGMSYAQCVAEVVLAAAAAKMMHTILHKEPALQGE